MSRKEMAEQQPRQPAPNPKGAGRPVQQFATKMTDEDINQIVKWIVNKANVVDCIYTLVETRGISDATAYRWYERVALLIGHKKRLLTSR